MMKKTTYRLDMLIPTRQLVPRAGTLMDELNTHMADFGHHEKLDLTTTLPCELTVARELTPEELTKMTGIVEEEMRKKFPGAVLGSVTKEEEEA